MLVKDFFYQTFDFVCCSPAVAPDADCKIFRPQIELFSLQRVDYFFICDADIGNTGIVYLVKYIRQVYRRLGIYLESTTVKELSSGTREQSPFLDDKTLFLRPQVQ